MSGWGILAAGLAGGARAVGGIAEGKIDQERRLESAQAISDIEEQKQKRIDERRRQNARDDQTYNTTGQGFAELSAAKAADAKQSAALALEAKRNEASDQGLIDAQRSKAKGDAEAAHETANAMLLADASNPALRKAQWDAAMNDPRTKAAYNASMASAGASAASARFDALRYAQLKEVGGVASNVRLLQDKLSKTQDPTERDSIQQQISDLGFAGKDPGKFLSVAERAQDNVAAALRAMNDPAATDESRAAAKKAMERAVELSTKAAAMAGIKMTSDVDASVPPPQAAIDALKKNPDKAADFDAKFPNYPGGAAAVIGGNKQAVKDEPAVTATPAARPAYVPPPDSPMGKMRARNEAAAAAREAGILAQQKKAADAYASLPPGDVRAAARLQASPLFSLLSQEQQLDVFKRVNGQ